jgi:hypothetical protein
MQNIQADQIIEELTQIARTLTAEYRSQLNSNIHVADISYLALKSSDSSLTPKVHRELIDLLASSLNNKVYYNLEASIEKFKTSKNNNVRLVEDISLRGHFLVASSYQHLQTTVASIFKNLAGKHKDLETFLGVDDRGKTIVNIGHIASDLSAATATPLTKKISHFISQTPKELQLFPKVLLRELSKEHTTGIKFSFRRSDIDQNEFSRILGTGTVLVTVQSTARNSDLASIEGQVSKKLLEYVQSTKFRNKLLKIPGSNSIEKDIELNIESLIKTGKNITSKHSKVTRSNTIKSSKAKVTTYGTRLPQLRKKSGQFVSLVSLQNLINQALPRKLQDNMVAPKLVYRTGRFAESVNVTKITRSRNDMLSIFYSYMKYPYQTFEPGFKQGSIARNPRTLINTSIRDIASNIVSNSLRVVGV